MKRHPTRAAVIAAVIIGAALFFTLRPVPQSESAIAREHRGKLKLFILAGQSNMSGKGGIPASARRTNPNIYVFGNDYQWKPAVEPVDDPAGQVDKVSEDEGVGFGPSAAFASALLKRDARLTIGLIPCARSGTSIYQWRQNFSRDSLYGSCLYRARIASRMGEVAGLLFFQGEEDALAPAQYPDGTRLPEDWDKEFVRFVESWREDLRQPDLPVVFAQIGSHKVPERATQWKVTQERQSAVRLPFCRMIQTDDLALKDKIHFTTESYHVIGERFAEAYWELAQGK